MVEDWYSLFEKEIQGLNEEVFKLLEKEYIDIVDSLAQPLLDGLQKDQREITSNQEQVQRESDDLETYLTEKKLENESLVNLMKAKNEFI